MVITTLELKNDITTSEWIKIKHKMLITGGGFNPETWNRLNSHQRYFINELKKSIRKIKE